jgi:hypothetical protein
MFLCSLITQEAARLYVAADHLFSSPTVTRHTVGAVQLFANKDVVQDEDDIDQFLQRSEETTDTRDTPVDEYLHTESSIKSESPYTSFFANAVAQAGSSCGDTNAEDEGNRFYSPAAFRILTSVIHLIPLWSRMMYSSDDNPVDCYSNQPVETHFGCLKNGVLQKSIRLRPREFLDKNLAYLQGKLQELKLPQNPRDVRRPKKKSAKDSKEVWKGGRKTKKKYSDPKVSEAVFGNASTSAEIPHKPTTNEVLLC